MHTDISYLVGPDMSKETKYEKNKKHSFKKVSERNKFFKKKRR